MAEFVLSIMDITSFNRAAGDYVAVGDWVSGFDHAALVTAHRSRADGKDLRMRNTATGNVPIVAISGLNTTNCRIGFNLTAAILGSMGDAGYRVSFGDLGMSLQSFVAAGSTGPGLCTATPGSVPAVALPLPGYDLTETVGYGVRSFSTLVTRTASLDEFASQRLRAQWRACSGETAYEIRAVVESVKGAGTVSFLGYDYVIVPGSLDWVQESALHFNVSLELDAVQL